MKTGELERENDNGTKNENENGNGGEIQTEMETANWQCSQESWIFGVAQKRKPTTGSWKSTDLGSSLGLDCRNDREAAALAALKSY